MQEIMESKNWWVCDALTSQQKNLGLLDRLEEFPKRLYHRLKILTVVLGVKNSGIPFSMIVSHRGTLF